MFNRWRTYTSVVTFDVGSTGIRACQVRASGREVWVADALRIDLQPPGAPGTAPAQAAASPAAPPPAAPTGAAGTEAVATARLGDLERVARMMEQGTFAGRDVAMILSPPDIRFHALRLPETALTQPAQVLHAALAFEVAREARCEPGELEVRHWALPPGHQQGLNVMAVSLAARRAAEFVESLTARRLCLRRLDVSPCALVRLALREWTPAPRELWAVLECGFRGSVLTVVVGDAIAYVRCLPISTDQWTRRVAEAFEIPYADAERLKRTHGVAHGDGEAPQADENRKRVESEDLPRVLFGLLRDALDGLVREIDLCCSYVLRSFPDVSVTRLMLAGGGASLRGLGEYLALHLGLPVSVLSGAGGLAGPAPVIAGRRAAGRPSTSPAPSAARPDLATALGGALLDLEAA